jgi:hypothetical protein
MLPISEFQIWKKKTKNDHTYRYNKKKTIFDLYRLNNSFCFILHILFLFQKHIPQPQTSSLKDTKKKSKFVPLFSQEGQEKAVIKLQGIKEICTHLQLQFFTKNIVRIL